MIARRSLLILINNVIGAGFGFFSLNFLLSFPKEAYGYYVWALSFVGILAMLSALGYTQAHIKRVNEGLDKAEANGTFFLIKTGLTCLFSIAAFGFYYVWTQVIGKGFTDSTTDAVFVTVIVFYLLLSLRQFFDTVFQAHQHTARAESVLLLDTIVMVGGIALTWGMWEQSQGRVVPFAAVVSATRGLLGIDGPIGPQLLALLIACSYVMGKAVSLLYSAFQFFVHRYPMGTPNWGLFRAYTRLGLPLALVGGLNVLYANVDRIFLGFFYDGNAVSNFQGPYQILTPMLFFSTAVGTLLFPTISRLDASGDHAEIRAQTQRAERYLSMLLLPQIVLAFVFAREGINIFNAQYTDQADILRVLLVFAYFIVLASPARMILLGAGRPRALLQLGLLNVVLVVGLNLLFVPRQGLGLAELGAALVTSLAAVVSYAYTKFKTQAWMGRDWVPPGVLRQWAAALIVGAAAWMVRSALGGDAFLRLWQLVLVGAVGTVAYVGVLALLREFTAKDWHFFWDVVHPVKMAGYVGRELTPQAPRTRPPDGDPSSKKKP